VKKLDLHSFTKTFKVNKRVIRCITHIHLNANHRKSNSTSITLQTDLVTGNTKNYSSKARFRNRSEMRAGAKWVHLQII